MSHFTTEKTYTHILPISENQIDIFDVFTQIQLRVAKWMTLFYDAETFDADLHTAYNNTALFRHFYVASKNIQKLNGAQTFGFGFPIAIDKDINNETITAPLFIWYLQIKPHPTQPDSWIISFDENCAVLPNSYFLHHAALKHQVDLTADFENLLQTHPFGQTALEDFCKKISKKLHFANPNSKTDLRETPKGEVIEQLATFGDIVWSGILGLFPHQQGALQEGAQTDLDFKNEKISTANIHEFTILDDDASQRDALRTVLRNKITVIEGAHGTGKTHLAANIILNALSNGQKTAVIANDLASLMEIQNKLVDLGLGHLTFLLKDIYHDKKLFLDTMRNSLSAIRYPLFVSKRTTDNESRLTDNVFDKDDFLITLKQARRLMWESDERHTNLTQPVFGDENVTDVVGRLLSVNPDSQTSNNQSPIINHNLQIPGKELLINTLKPEEYDFTSEEHRLLHNALSKAKVLYPNVGTLKHPLGEVRFSFDDLQFSNDVENQSKIKNQKSKIENSLLKARQQLMSLRHEYIQLYDNYSEQLLEYYETYHFVLRKKISELENAFSDYRFQYGDSFESNNFLRISSLYATSLFNDKSKNILSAKDDVVKNYNALEKIHNERKHFLHHFLKPAERKDFVKVEKNLEDYGLIVKGWRKRLPRVMQEELQRLNSKTANFFDKDLSENIKTLEQKMDALLDDINNTPIFSQPLTHKMLTISKRMQFIDDTIEKFNDVLLSMRDYDTFYGWQQFWQQQPPKVQKLIQALTKTSTRHWSSALDSWYFYNILVQNHQSRDNGQRTTENVHQQNIIDGDNFQFSNFDQNKMGGIQNLKSKIQNQIAFTWNKRKKEAIKNLEEKSPADWNKLFVSRSSLFGFSRTRSTDNTSRITDNVSDILKKNINTITEIFPVLLVTPQVATQIVELEGKEFDRVIFDNAQTFDAQQAAIILRNTHSAVIMTEYAHNEGFGVTSLAGLARANGAAVVRLNYIHHHAGQNVHRFNESVFYKDVQIPSEVRDEKQELNWHDVNGKYNAATKINEREIMEVGEILEKIDFRIDTMYRVSTNTYPKIGIICASEAQRDAIAIHLLNIVQKSLYGWQKIEQMQRNGLVVCHINEMTGQHFDIMIVSGTFSKSEQIAFTKQQMRQLLNSFNKNLYWINSIPIEELENASRNKNNEIQFLAGNILLWCQRSSLSLNHNSLAGLSHNLNTDNESSENIFKNLKAQYGFDNLHRHSQFVDAVAKTLSSKMITPTGIPTVEIKKSYKIADLIFDLVILPTQDSEKPETPKAIVVRIDGNLQSSRFYNAEWEAHLHQILEKNGVKVVCTYSFDWWKNKQTATEKLFADLEMVSEAKISEKSATIQ